MTRTEEAARAILRRYRETVAAGFPADWAMVRQFAAMNQYAASPTDRNLARAAEAVETCFRFLKVRQPSVKALSRVLAAIAIHAPQ